MWGPNHINHHTPVLELTTLKCMRTSLLLPLDSLRIRVCFIVSGVIVPPSHSNNLTFVVPLPESLPHHKCRLKAFETQATTFTEVGLGRRPELLNPLPVRLGPQCELHQSHGNTTCHAQTTTITFTTTTIKPPPPLAAIPTIGNANT